MLSDSDRKAFASAAGGWSNVDVDRLVEDIYASRRISHRLPVDLGGGCSARLPD